MKVMRSLVGDATGGGGDAGEQCSIIVSHLLDPRRIDRAGRVYSKAGGLFTPEGEFAAGCDVGMAGKDLLDEGRAGTRHAEDQDRHIPIGSKAGIARKQVSGELRN